MDFQDTKKKHAINIEKKGILQIQIRNVLRKDVRIWQYMDIQVQNIAKSINMKMRRI
jgi:hypothetical protein